MPLYISLVMLHTEHQGGVMAAAPAAGPASKFLRPCRDSRTQPHAPLWAQEKVLGWPKRWKLARAFLWEYSCKRLQLAQLLGQLGVFRAVAEREHM